MRDSFGQPFDFALGGARFGPWRAFLILSLLGAAAYGQTFFYPFVHDDIVFIRQNPNIVDFDLKEIFLKTSVPSQSSSIINTYYRPLLEVFYRIQYRLFHFNPAGYHLFNVMVHIFNSFLIYRLAGLIGSGFSAGFAFAAAILFLLHPLQSEAVACISGISNLLFALFVFLSLYFDRVCADRRRMGCYALSLVFFLMALFAKEQAMILPFLVLLFELCFPRVPTAGKFSRLSRISGYFLVLAGYWMLRAALLGEGALPSLTWDHELVLRLLSIPRTLLTYLGLVFFPYHLHYYRSVDILEPFGVPWASAGLVLAGIVGLIRRALLPHKSFLIFGAAWFLISLFPVLNIIPLVNEYSWILTAEHFLYVPLAGGILFVLGCGCWGLSMIKDEQKRRRAGIFILAAIILICLTAAVRQNTYWSSEVSLFERSVRFEGKLGRVHILLGRSYYQAGRIQESVREYTKAGEIFSAYISKIGNGRARDIYLGFLKGIHFDLAHCFEALGDFAGAVREYENALAIDPSDGVIHNNLGVSYLHWGMTRVPQAVRHFEEALRLNENDLMALQNLAVFHLQSGDRRQAEIFLRKILAKDPLSVFAGTNLEKLSPPPAR